MVFSHSVITSIFLFSAFAIGPSKTRATALSNTFCGVVKLSIGELAVHCAPRCQENIRNCDRSICLLYFDKMLKIAEN